MYVQKVEKANWGFTAALNRARLRDPLQYCIHYEILLSILAVVTHSCTTEGHTGAKPVSRQREWRESGVKGRLFQM